MNGDTIIENERAAILETNRSRGAIPKAAAMPIKSPANFVSNTWLNFSALGIELIPGGDILPLYTVAFALSIYRLKSAGANITFITIFLFMCMAILNDLLDWFVVGSIPIIGDIIDLVTSLTFGLWVKFKEMKLG